MASYNFDPKKKEEVKTSSEDKTTEAKPPKKKFFRVYTSVMPTARYGNPIVSIVVGSFFSVIAIAVMLVFALLVNNVSGRIACEAEITDIKQILQYDRYEMEVYVSYTIGTESHEMVQLGTYESGMRKGDKITIYYLENDHENIRYVSIGTQTWPYVICGLFLVAGVSTIVVTAIRLVKAKKQPAI